MKQGKLVSNCFKIFICFVLEFLFVTPLSAGEVRVAVASNFITTARILTDEFSTQYDHQVLTSFGSTGKFFAQIHNGAPFDVFLSADAERPRLLEQTGAAVGGSRFTYAIGKLVLWASDKVQLKKDCLALLKDGKLRRLAIANPKTAPYGLAAQQTLQKMALWEKLKPRLVRGENIAQAYQYVATGNARLGFVALSQVLVSKGSCRWDVPHDYYEPIEQQAVLLNRGKHNEAALAFIAFLQSKKARAIIVNAGYAI